MWGSNPSTGADSLMSRAMPWGRPSMMSIRTTSAKPLWTTRMAVVAPTNPLPTTVTRMARPLRDLLPAVAGPGPDGPHHAVAALHHDPAHRSCRRSFLQIPVRLLGDLVVDREPWIHPPGEGERELERPILPDGRHGLDVPVHVGPEQLLLIRLLEPLHQRALHGRGQLGLSGEAVPRLLLGLRGRAGWEG